jgi:hypothetical protein
MMSGIPIGAAITVTISMMPTMVNTNPRTTATNLPVKLRIKVSSFQIATKGHKNHGVDLSFLVIFSFILYQHTYY